MWKLRKEFLCAYMDGDAVSNDITKKIIDYQKLVENNPDFVVTRMFLFLDNFSYSRAQELREILENNKENGSQYIILFAERAVVLSEEGRGHEAVIVLKNNLMDDEKKKFTAKLELLKSLSLTPVDMLSFVIMAHNNEESEYVKNTVKNNLKGILQRKQEKLINILSIYKVFSDGNLSKSFVDQYLGHSKADVMKRLCANITPFIEEKMCSEEGFGNYSVLQITHAPVANQVLKYFNHSEKQTVQATLIEFLDEVGKVNLFYRTKMYEDILKLLCDR